MTHHLLLALLLAAGAASDTRFREAGELARQGDYPKAIAAYQELATEGAASASLYWNWAQAASARGATGEALWALLQARELEPGDAAVGREIERLRERLDLDAAEIAPEPRATLARTARRVRLDLAALLLLAASLAGHAGARLLPGARWPRPVAWCTFGLGTLLAGLYLIAVLAGPTGVVLRRGAALLDSASPTAQAIGTLREGEVVPILVESGDYVRVEDSSGARGWARREDLRAVRPGPGYRL
jgi:hypothetical protein